MLNEDLVEPLHRRLFEVLRVERARPPIVRSPRVVLVRARSLRASRSSALASRFASLGGGTSKRRDSDPAIAVVKFSATRPTSLRMTHGSNRTRPQAPRP